VSERTKMAASALVAAALTAALFLTFGSGPSHDAGPSARPGNVADGRDAPHPGAHATPGSPSVSSGSGDLTVVEGDGVITGRVLSPAGEELEGSIDGKMRCITIDVPAQTQVLLE